MISNTRARTTFPMGDGECPRCGQQGQEKYRHSTGKRAGRGWYRYFDHYRTFRRKGTRGLHRSFIRSCYIERVPEDNKIMIQLKERIPLSKG